jgi:2-succinyl-5-enolpyruvyl-6-hydroxy-3-cyclohexene-1-carboxylate synthase
VFVGSSSSVRDLDLSAPRTGRLSVVASRGLAGIDGCVSTAVGIALAGGDPTYALMGDLTFLHDANGLLIGPMETRPDLTLVVVNDDGGGIFTLLEPGEPGRGADFERVFGTPTGVDLAALCAAHHVRHELVTSQARLADALATRPDGLSVLEVSLDRSLHRDQHAALRQAAADALREGGAAAYPAR